MWSNNVPLPAPGRLALIILSRVGCRQYEHVAREGDTTIPPSSVRLQRHTTLHIITLDLIPSYLLLSASRAHSSEYFRFAWSSFIWFEIEFENYLHVVDTIGQWSMDEWTLPAAVSRVFRSDYDSFKSRLGPLPVIRPQVVLVRSTVSPPPIQLGQTSKHNQLQYSIGLQTLANK